MFVRIGHALPDHLEHDIGLFREAAFFPPEYPHEETALDKTHKKIEQGSSPYMRVENTLLLPLSQDVYHQGHHPGLIERLVGHPCFHRQGHENYLAEPFVPFVVVKLQPENLAKLFLKVFNSLQVVDNAVRQFSHPDIDKGEDQPFLAAVMLVNRGKAHPCFVGNIADGRTVKVGIGENLQDRILKSFVYVSAQFVQLCCWFMVI